MVNPSELNKPRNIYYFPVVASTRSNSIQIIPLESSNAYVSSTNYVNDSGYSTHPNIFSFISQVGITEAPNYENFTFEYLLKYSQTNGVVVSSNNFDTTTRDISFIPENTKNYYTGTIQNRFITFTNLTGQSTTFEEYPNRQLNYFITETILEGGGEGEGGGDTNVYWMRTIIEKCGAEAWLAVETRLDGGQCKITGKLNFSIDATRSCSYEQCKEQDEPEQAEFSGKGECDLRPDKMSEVDQGHGFGDTGRRKSRTTWKYYQTKLLFAPTEKDRELCNRTISRKGGVEFETGADGKIKTKFFGTGYIPADATTAAEGGTVGPGIGVLIAEEAITIGATAIIPVTAVGGVIGGILTLPGRALWGPAAGAILPKGIIADGIKVVASPVRSVLGVPFDLLNDALTTTLEGSVTTFNAALDLALTKIPGCSIPHNLVEGENRYSAAVIDLLLDKDTPVGKAFSKLEDIAYRLVGNCPCKQSDPFN